jgi:hypothetical protein
MMVARRRCSVVRWPSLAIDWSGEDVYTSAVM